MYNNYQKTIVDNIVYYPILCCILYIIILFLYYLQHLRFMLYFVVDSPFINKMKSDYTYDVYTTASSAKCYYIHI